ncbi:hypothetical protein SCA6_014815 [Theobroma cacao]
MAHRNTKIVQRSKSKLKRKEGVPNYRGRRDLPKMNQTNRPYPPVDALYLILLPSFDYSKFLAGIWF